MCDSDRQFLIQIVHLRHRTQFYQTATESEPAPEMVFETAVVDDAKAALAAEVKRLRLVCQEGLDAHEQKAK